MDQYIGYVRALIAQGYATTDIENDLLSKGINPETIKWLLQVTKETILTPPSAVSGNAQAVQFPRNPVPATITASPQAVALSQPQPETFRQRINKPTPAVIATDSNTPVLFGISKGYLIAALLCAFPSLLIILYALSGHGFGTATQTLLALGDLIGTIGLCLYVFDIILSTRLSQLEDLFGGLNKVYQAHAIIGGAALIAIMIHPVLLGLRYTPLGMHSVGVFFIPSTKYIATAFGIFALAFMILLMVLTLYVRLPYRIWLWSHKGLALVYILICLHVLYQPNDISNHFLIRWYLILIMVAGLAAVTYRTFLPNVLVRRYLYIIKTVEKKATGVIEITLTPTNKEIQYKEGQFIFISFHADGLSSEWHPFTIASSPGNGSISIDVKSLGSYTETITRLLPSMAGMAVSIEGAYGRFSYRNFHNVNQVWIAGGIGITPFISMAQSLGSGNYNIDLYYSVKSEAELIDLDILASKQSNKPNQVFRTIPFVNDKYKGFLTADIIKANSGDLHNRDFLICGPPPIMNTVKKQLLAAGVSKYKIHTEEFSIT